jgi:hypothetical protein
MREKKSREKGRKREREGGEEETDMEERVCGFSVCV